MKTRQYNNGDTCTVSANPGSHYTFDGWFENDSIVSSDNPYSFTVSGNRTLEGKFTANSYTITTNVSPVSGGNISGGGTYDYGDTCTLTATENQDYTFATWTDGDGNFLSNDNPFSFTVSGDLTVRGVFSTGFNTYTITVISPHGSVSGDGVYALDDTCTLTSTPNAGYLFDHWEMNGVEISDDNPYSFTVNGDKTITAVYEVIPASLKITVNGPSSVILTNSSNQTYTWNLSSGLNEYFGDEPGFAFNEITGLKKDSNATNIISIDASELTSWINIESSAFYVCNSLTSITLPNSITSIDNSAFQSCNSLTSINLPNSITDIYSSAFRGCSNLTSIVLPDSLIQLWPQAFFNSGLTSLNIPASTTYIGTNIINGFNVGSITVNPGNTTFDSRNNCNAIIETATNTLRVGCRNSTIPNTVEIIGSYSFNNIGGLTSITLHNGITQIGNSAFKTCVSLTSITSLNTTPPTLGTQAFDSTNNCPIYVPWSADHSVYNSYVSSWSTYSSRIVEMPNPTPQPSLKITTSGSTSVILTNSSNQTYTWNLSSGLNEYTGDEPGFALDEITNLRKGVGDTSDDYYLLSIDASELTSWTTVENSAFRFLPNLNSIILPDYITSIGQMAFYVCNSLTSITLPNSLTTIDSGAFESCTSLTSINIPASVNNIIYDILSNCDSLTSITVDANNQYYNDGNGSNCIIRTSTNTLIQGCKTTVIPNTVVKIGLGAFENCTGLTSINIPNSITTIGQAAFFGCSSLTSITLPNSLTTLGNGAFEYCHGLTSITLPNSLTTIGTDIFFYCDSLTSLIIPRNVSSIGEGIVGRCSSLTSLTVDSNNVNYNDGNGSNCIIETATNRLVAGCNYTTIPNTVVKIGNRALGGCTGLTSITLSNSITSIGYAAFENCNSLTSITCLAITPPTLGTDAFYNTNNCPIYVPSASLSAYQSAWSQYASRLNAL